VTKIVAVGRNYAAHAAEHGDEVPSQPLIFLKPPSAVIGPGESIVCPPQSAQVEHETELAVVIGQRARRVAAANAWAHVLGYTCANDVTARDLQRSDGQWSRAKGFDTFAPLGPWIVTELDPTDLNVVCRVNGQVKQQASTADMVFKIPQLIEYITAAMTLEPGDVILTGTPEGVSPIRPSDHVEVEVEGIGVLRNPVVAA
jgi:2-keto-4-pentenoate hydratase/2-oxohepta-3-ene-1,7-dioic acid hydratase in catechol pathway